MSATPCAGPSGRRAPRRTRCSGISSAWGSTEHRGGIISHNDPNLDNVIFSAGRAVALIDFDLASPGSAVWDVERAARLWAPLREESDAPDQLRGLALAWLRTFVDAYGLPARDRARVVEAMVVAHEWCYDVVRAAVAHGHETFERVWRNGGRSRAERTATWLATHGGHMHEALGLSQPRWPPRR